jgi:mercuric ion transport protein
MEKFLDPVVTTGCSLTSMTVKEHFTAASGRGQTITAAGGLLGALAAASSCCIMPVALFSLGISGAWIGNFTQLAPFQPYFLAATLLCLVAGYWLVHRASKRTCAAGEACAQPLPNRLVKGMLVIATVLVVAAIGFDLLAPLLLNS